jgi:hypothetical protein
MIIPSIPRRRKWWGMEGFKVFIAHDHHNKDKDKEK